jgi:hypothetical protein
MQWPIGSRFHSCRPANPVYHRTIGFRALATQAGQLAAAVGATTIAGEAEDRNTVAALLYYLRDQPTQILARPAPHVPKFDTTRPLTKNARQPIVFVTECASAQRLGAYYATVEKIGEIRPATGPTTSRDYTVFSLSDPRDEITALPPCPLTRASG